MRQTRHWMLAAILVVCGVNGQAQTKRSDDFRAKYELKEVVVMSRVAQQSAVAAWRRVGNGDGAVLPQMGGR